jgi:nucleotide-binding universal stress UspA family protein
MKAKPAKQKGNLLLEMNDKDSDRLAAAGKATMPFRIKRILVPTDFSACSKKALQYALPFARQFGATIILVNVIPMPPLQVAEFSDVDIPFLAEQCRSENRRRLKQLASDEIEELTPIEEVIRDGKPHLEIVEVAKKMEADLIIISTHGDTGLKRFFLGSVAEHVVRHAPCPVLVVREKETEFI